MSYEEEDSCPWDMSYVPKGNSVVVQFSTLQCSSLVQVVITPQREQTRAPTFENVLQRRIFFCLGFFLTYENVLQGKISKHRPLTCLLPREYRFFFFLFLFVFFCLECMFTLSAYIYTDTYRQIDNLSMYVHTYILYIYIYIYI